MFGSEILDVAIGMILVYLLLSLICSAVNEIIEAWLKKRATDLERGIRELLRDWEGEGVVKDLYQHPLISGLFRGEYKPTDLSHKSGLGNWLREKVSAARLDARKSGYRLRGLLLNRGGTDLPSYIPTRNFALAMIDLVLQNASSTAALRPASPPANLLSSPPASPPRGTYPGGYSIEDLRVALDAFPYAGVRKALTALVDAAGNDVNQARANIEKWFDSSMDRVSGWYKRRTQVIVLLLGLGTAVVVNADTIAIFKSLANDPALRKSLVAAAPEYAKSAPAPAASPAPAPAPDPESDVEACRKDANSPRCRVDANLQELEKFGLPIGWDCGDERAVPECLALSSNSSLWVLPSLRAWAPKVVGWILTAIALSLGAPFWFDLLNKFMIVRSTVKPHEKSPEEKPVG